MVVFETERLIARKWDADWDAEAAFRMYGDPEVMRYLGRDPQVAVDIADVRARLEKSLAVYAERNNGTGAWALEEKDGGAVIGAVLVKHLPDADNIPTQDLEVGWHLQRA